MPGKKSSGTKTGNKGGPKKGPGTPGGPKKGTG